MIGEKLRVLSDPTRLKIILSLKRGRKNVSELVKIVGGTQANISKHLKILERGGIIKREREGVKIFYEIKNMEVFKIIDCISSSLRNEILNNERLILEIREVLEGR